jgi:molybdate transport system regulatory protein
MSSKRTPDIRVRLVWDGFMFGPGKAELLQRIDETGSISAAGKAMGMSYKRAWLLVETMNAAFREPLVESSRGGAKGGGAKLTPMGRQALTFYLASVQNVRDAAGDPLSVLTLMLNDQTPPH